MARRSNRRLRLFTAALAVLLVAVTGAGATAWRQNDRARGRHAWRGRVSSRGGAGS